MAEFCDHSKIPIIHISTDYVFSGDKDVAYSEDDVPNPINIYGRSKLEGEIAIASVCNNHVIIRSSWIFGQRGSCFVKTIIKKALDGVPIYVVTNEIGCPTSTLGLAHCILGIATQIYRGNSAWGTYHFCGFPEINRYQYAVDIIDTAKTYLALKNSRIEPLIVNELCNQARRPCHSAMKTDKILNAFNIKPDNWRVALANLIPLLLLGR